MLPRVALAVLSTFFLPHVAADNEAIQQPECDANKTVSVRYSSTSARLYLEAPEASSQRGGCVTLSQIFQARSGKAPLYAIDPHTGSRVEEATGTWLLTESLYVEDGITLRVGAESWPLLAFCLSRDEEFNCSCSSNTVVYQTTVLVVSSIVSSFVSSK